MTHREHVCSWRAPSVLAPALLFVTLVTALGGCNPSRDGSGQDAADVQAPDDALVGDADLGVPEPDADALTDLPDADNDVAVDAPLMDAAFDVPADTDPEVDTDPDGVSETGENGFEYCDNGEDDDLDGLSDCEDPECEGHAWCQSDDVWIYYHVSGESPGLRAFRTDESDVAYSVTSPDAPDLPLSLLGFSPRGDYLVVGANYGRSSAMFILDLRTGGLRRWAGADDVRILGWVNNNEFVGMWYEMERGVSWVAFGTFDTRAPASREVIRYVPGDDAVHAGALSPNGDEYVYGAYDEEDGNPFAEGGVRTNQRLVAVDVRANSARDVPVDEAPFAIHAVPGLGGYLFRMQGGVNELRDGEFEFVRRVAVSGMELTPIDAQRVASIARGIQIQTWTGAPVSRHVPVDSAGEEISTLHISRLWSSPVGARALEPFFALGRDE